MINHFGGIGASGGARRGHLALIVGGQAQTTGSSTVGARTATAYVRGGGQEAARSRQHTTVQEVARRFRIDQFDLALPEMVQATIASPESAKAVYRAISGNERLRTQALRAFQAAHGAVDA